MLKDVKICCQRKGIRSEIQRRQLAVTYVQSELSHRGIRGGAGKLGSGHLPTESPQLIQKNPAFAADIESAARRQHGGNSAGTQAFEPRTQPFHGPGKPATGIRSVVVVLVIAGNDGGRRHFAHPPKTARAHEKRLIVRRLMCRPWFERCGSACNARYRIARARACGYPRWHKTLLHQID